MQEKKKKGRIENLRTPTTDEAREMGTLGGIASGVARRKRKDLRETALAFLEATGYSDGDKKVDGYTAMIGALVEKALKGDVSAFTAIRDTAGQKPVDTLNLNDTRPKSIEIEFVDKSKPKMVEKDPKIIGESSPTVGNDRK